MNDQNLLDRLIELETKISHQDFQVEKLEKIVFDQQSQIDQLEKTVAGLLKTLKMMAGNDIGPGNEKPPHY